MGKNKICAYACLFIKNRYFRRKFKTPILQLETKLSVETTDDSLKEKITSLNLADTQKVSTVGADGSWAAP